jgi:hypothetical protein
MGMRPRLTRIAFLAILPLLSRGALADPITGNITLTVAPAAPFFQGPVVYSSGPVNPSQLFQSQIEPGPDPVTLYQGLTMNGPLLVKWSGLGSESFTTPFDMKITFAGAAGSQPTVDVTGSLTVNAYSTPDESASNGLASASKVSISANATQMSATVQGWTPASGIPLSLINQYLATSSYQLFQTDNYTFTPSAGFPTTSSFDLMADPSAVTPVPEPAPVLMYVAAIAGFGVWRSRTSTRSRVARRRRSTP